MAMTRARDLSGFNVDPGSAKGPDSDPPTAPGPTQKTQPRAKAVERRRVTLSLPWNVAAALRNAASESDRYFFDIIVEAFSSHAVGVTDSAKAGRLMIGVQSPRRFSGGRTQIPLTMATDDLGVLDDRAALLGLNRSAYVAELLAAHLGIADASPDSGAPAP